MKWKKLIVFLSESETSPVKLSHSIGKYFTELDHELAKVYLTLPRDPPVVKSDPTLTSFRDFSSPSRKYEFLNHPAYLLNPNDNFLLSHQKLALMQTELLVVHPELKGDPVDSVSRIVSELENGLELLLLEKNVMEQSLDFSGRPELTSTNSLFHSKQDFLKIELNLIKLGFIDFFLERFRTKPFRKLSRRLEVDKTLIYFQTMMLLFQPRMTRFDLSSTGLEDFMGKKALSSSGLGGYCRELLRKYGRGPIEIFLQKFEEHVDSFLTRFEPLPQFSQLCLWHRIQLLEFLLNFNENLKFQKKIIQNMKLVKSQVQFSPQVQFKVACLELKYLVQVKDVEQLLSLLNNLHFFEPFCFDVVKAFHAIHSAFRLDIKPVAVSSILDKLMIITNYEIQKCQIDPETPEHFLVDFWLYLFTQVEEVNLKGLVVSLRTDAR